MCHNRTINNKINRLHERCLRIVYNDNKSSFQELLDKDKGVTIHVKNVRTLAVEMFKVSNNYSTSLVSEIFDKRNNDYDFRNSSEFARHNVRSVFNGTESISFLGPKILDIVPSELKQLETVNAFKREIKNWKPVTVPAGYVDHTYRMLVVHKLDISAKNNYHFFNIYVISFICLNNIA